MMKLRQQVQGEVREQLVEQPSFEEQFDVLVAGVGTAGALAVIAAAEQGARVLGVEQLQGIGGMGTMGYVSGYYYGLPGGRHVEIDEQAQAIGREHFLDRVEAKKYVMEQRITASGAQLSLETTVCGVYLEDEHVRGVQLFARGRLWAVACRTLIDATADARVAMLAGCSTRLGRESDGKTRPFTSVKVWLTSKGTITRTNHDSGYVDPYDPFALSQGILQAHASQDLPEFQDADKRVLFFAPFIGIREGRLVECERQITMPDVLAGRRDPEPLFYGYADFDKHGKDNALESEELQDLYVAANLSTACFAVPVGVRSMMPKGVQGMLVAGRHLGVDHDVASLLRMQRDMQKCGESAGIIAALAAKRDCAFTEVPYEELQALLLASGCLQHEHDRGIWFDDSFRREAIQWLHEPQEIRAALATDMPGVAIYSCKRLGDALSSELKAWIASTDEQLSSAAAIALGISGHSEAAPRLREIVAARDAYYYKDCRRTNQFRSVIAVYLLGKLGDADSVEMLTGILCDPREVERELYHEIKETSYKLNTTKNFNELYYQMITYSAVALLRIADRHPHLRTTIHAALDQAFADERHIRNTTSMPPLTYEYESVGNVRDYVRSIVHASASAASSPA